MTPPTSTPIKTRNRALAVGDWVYFEFKLSKIDEMEGDRIVAVSDGYFRTGGNDLQCVPLTVENKAISEEYERHSKRIHKEGHGGLNYPRIHDWMVDQWWEACEKARRGQSVDEHYKAVRKFADDVLRLSDVDSGYGFKLNISQR